jgi:hypothetical protein
MSFCTVRMSLPDHDATIEVEVLDAQAQRFEHAQATAVEKTRDEHELAVELREDATNLRTCEDGRELLGARGAYHSFQPRQINVQHTFVEK